MMTAIYRSQSTALEQIDTRPLTSKQRSLIALAVVANISEFFDIFLIGFAVNALLKDPSWHLRGDEAGIILAMSGLGTVLGAIMAGRLADAIGRKRTSFWCILLFSVFTVASVFTPTGAWEVLALLRVFVGVRCRRHEHRVDSLCAGVRAGEAAGPALRPHGGLHPARVVPRLGRVLGDRVELAAADRARRPADLSLDLARVRAGIAALPAVQGTSRRGAQGARLALQMPIEQVGS